MAWDFVATIARDVHRIADEAGTIAWGIDHHGVDRDSVAANGEVIVTVPTGEATLLLVDPLPGGLVLDVVRAFHGLTEAEVHTLFRGVFDELAHAEQPTSRLSLECFGLDASGRPRLIPGLSRPLETTVRRAVGELVYHAVHGAPWSESLLPVGVALEESSETLRALVADLLADEGGSAPDSLPAVLAEVGPRLSRLPAPAALPMVPDGADLDPALALTARLRAMSETDPLRGGRETPSTTRGSADSRPARSAAKAPRSLVERLSALRTPTGRSEEARPVPSRRPRSAHRRRGRSVFSAAFVRVRGRSATRIGLVAAMAVVLVGGLLMVRAWSAAEGGPTPTAGQAAPQRGTDAEEHGAYVGDDADVGDDANIADADIAARLGELCAERAQALTESDAAALAALTVPGSSAAAADELIDLPAYAGGAYEITVDDVAVDAREESEVRVTATMTTHAQLAGQERTFDAKDVVFTLRSHDGEWRIAEVADLGE